jgi:hypothetical protein
VDMRAASYENPATGREPTEEVKIAEPMLELIRDYARERPEIVALWAFGLGFVLGWKLKPW